jgi:nitroreductase
MLFLCFLNTMGSEIEILSSIIQRRRSIFPPSYTAEEIPDELIRQVLESANYAPTHKLTQPWRFIVLRKEAKHKFGLELARLYQEQTPQAQFLQKKYESLVEKADQSSCIIVLNAELHPDLIPEWEEIAAFACAVQNMSLTAEALNIGAYWSSPGTIAQLPEYFNMPANEKCFGLFFMGFHNEEPRPARRSPMEDKVRWIED